MDIIYGLASYFTLKAYIFGFYDPIITLDFYWTVGCFAEFEDWLEFNDKWEEELDAPKLFLDYIGFDFWDSSLSLDDLLFNCAYFFDYSLKVLSIFFLHSTSICLNWENAVSLFTISFTLFFTLSCRALFLSLRFIIL